MDRLTTWNGSKYILPQGRTAEGESYWRIIADKLAQYENNDPEAKEMRYGFSDIMMPIDNRRIERFVRVWNSDCEAIVKWWSSDPNWARGFEEHKSDHYWIKSQAEQASAMFFMGMLPDAKYSSNSYIYDFIKAEVDRRKGVSECGTEPSTR